MQNNRAARAAEVQRDNAHVRLLAAFLLMIAAIYMICAVASPAHAQSFNCRYAKTPDEVAICDYPYLGDLDVQMASLYFSIRRQLHGSARKQLENDQKYWLRGRKRCGYDPACIQDSYNRRIYQLNYNY